MDSIHFSLCFTFQPVKVPSQDKQDSKEIEASGPKKSHKVASVQKVAGVHMVILCTTNNRAVVILM